MLVFSMPSPLLLIIQPEMSTPWIAVPLVWVFPLQLTISGNITLMSSRMPPKCFKI